MRLKFGVDSQCIANCLTTMLLAVVRDIKRCENGISLKLQNSSAMRLDVRVCEGETFVKELNERLRRKLLPDTREPLKVEVQNGGCAYLRSVLLSAGDQRLSEFWRQVTNEALQASCHLHQGA